jgi:hypothetical protein
MAYVSAYGNYGAERALFFEITDLTVAQWDTLAELGDGDRLSYVDAILNREPLDRWEA